MSPSPNVEFPTRRYKRREVLKGAVALGVTGPTLWRQSDALAVTTPNGPRWIAFGPVPTTQMYVSWSANGSSQAQPPSAPQIRWHLNKAATKHQPADRSIQVPLPGGVVGEPAERTFYNSTLLTSLAPGRTYHYSVSNDGRSWSTEHTFKTAVPGPSNFRFTAFGDQGIGTDTAAPMVSLVTSLKPAFHLLAGDLAYATPKGLAIPDVTDFHPEFWDTYLNIIGRTGAHSVPWLASVGAHEVEPLGSHGYDGFITRFRQHYDHSSGSPVVHTFRYGNVAFIHLDANDLSAQATINNGYTAGAQTAWLERKLAHYRSAGTGIDFIVVVCSCCCYSTNRTHGSDGGLRDVWGPLFDKYTVDLVVSGHVHAYERTNPIRAARPTRAVARGGTVHPATDGTTYICAGGGGKGLYTTWYGKSGAGDAGNSTAPKIWRWTGGDTAQGGSGRPEQVTDKTKGFSAFRQAAYSCLVVDVTAPSGAQHKTTMHIRALKPPQTAGAVTGIASPTVMDSVSIVRHA